jgi:hypothetical protein
MLSSLFTQDLVQRYQELQKELEVVKADLQFSQILENNEPDDLKELFISIRRDNTVNVVLIVQCVAFHKENPFQFE